MNRAVSNNLFRGFSHILAVVFNNATQFKRRWREYQSATGQAGGIEGRWLGEWVSEVNGHSGKLKCILSRAAPSRYQARFHATYAGFLRVCYTVTLNGREEDGRVRLEGEADLGALAGGLYRYEGLATPQSLNCIYQCKYDHGSFRMTRLD